MIIRDSVFSESLFLYLLIYDFKLLQCHYIPEKP